MSQQLSEKELAAYTKGQSLIDRLKALYDQQIDTWKLAKENYSGLNSVKVETKVFDDAEIKLQHNPHRVISTTADVSDETVNNRKCILCEENLPVEQKFIKYYKEYNFLINPYPILKEHFTIVKSKHVRQNITTYLNDLLLLSRDVGEKYVVFYNGPKCGASLPEHLHFQMGSKEQLPLYNYLNNHSGEKINQTIKTRKLKITPFTGTGRFGLIVESRDSVEILNFFSILLSAMDRGQDFSDEPMLNILSFFEDGNWRVVIFLRKKHRPHYYYKEDESKIVVSPASIDLAGLMIVPREEDLQKLNSRIIKDIYREVCITKELSEYILLQLQQFYN